MEHTQDTLTPLTRSILDLDEPQACTRLVVRGPGNPAARPLLEQMQSTPLLTPPAREPSLLPIRSALWLWHDFLDESHTLSQQIASATGSFWHAIMHRREGDFSNSKYWYARVEGHPVLATLGAQAGALLNPLPADKQLLRLNLAGWNPAAFVDLVEQIEDRPADPRRAVAEALQRLEWRLLFDHCLRAATAV